jgi:phenylpyruvate tautomerase PptA (4-oxalocrotonate tautomerase family)
MPTYTIQIPGAQLSGERKAALPVAIKDAHPKTTGAARDLTQASVLEISSASFWLHGTPSECHRIFGHGFVAAILRARHTRKMGSVITILSGQRSQIAAFRQPCPIHAQERPIGA